MADQTIAARNARLDALNTAVSFWAAKKRDEINKRVESSKKILKGRTGSERLAQASVQAASVLVVDSLNDFLLASG
jgi:hypothetical protein